MNYIVFGAGESGVRALHFLGWCRVGFFASSYPGVDTVEGKKVLTYDAMLEKLREDDYCVVVASYNYHDEMAAKLRKDGIEKFFVFHDDDFQKIYGVLPYCLLYRQFVHFSYTQVMSFNCIRRYKKIAVYGNNSFLPYLITEIAIQNSYENIVGVIPSSENDLICSVGVPLVTLQDIWDEIDCLVVNKRRNETTLFDELQEVEHNFDVVPIYEVEKFVPEFQHPELKRYKGIHKGKRCFIVGNGPSVRISDLDKIHENGDISFGFNKIFRIYDKTKWRPDYLCIADSRIIEDSQAEIPNLGGEVFVSEVYHSNFNPIFDCVQYVFLHCEEYGENHPQFAEGIEKGTFWGHTVSYDLGLQLAAYMGFSEIYLIGCDCSTVGNVTDEGNHFIKDYFKKDEKQIHEGVVPEWGAAFRAYEVAERYSSKHGFRIFNATRGGNLEVFERVDFDSLF